MVRIKAEDAGGLSPAKDDNDDTRHFIRRTLPIFGCVDYIVPISKAKRNKSFAGLFKGRGVQGRRPWPRLARREIAFP